MSSIDAQNIGGLANVHATNEAEIPHPSFRRLGSLIKNPLYPSRTRHGFRTLSHRKILVLDLLRDLKDVQAIDIRARPLDQRSNNNSPVSNP